MTPGVHKLPMSEYLSVRAFSASLAHTLLEQSPFHAWHRSPWNPDAVREDSNEADIGTYAHAMLLEGGHAGLVVVDAKDWRTNAAKEEREAARAAGKLAILAHKVSAVEAMVEAARVYLAASELRGVFESGAAEQTILWQEVVHAESGRSATDARIVHCKARPDWLTADASICVSYKTTDGSAEPNGWIRRQLPQYDVGMALYEHGIRAACKVERTRVVHLVQEQVAPYSCSLIGLSPASQDIAERKLARALATWEACLQRGQFPAYPANICWADPTGWQLAQEEERAGADAYAALPDHASPDALYRPLAL